MKWVKFDPKKRIAGHDNISGAADKIYIAPQHFEDFPAIKGMWVPTCQVGTHCSFHAWHPKIVDGRIQVWETREEYLAFDNSGVYYPMKIHESYPDIGLQE